MDLGFVRQPGGTVALGLTRRGGRDIVDMTECHVLDPRLFAVLAPLRALLRDGVFGRDRRGGAVSANLLDGGIDLLFRTGRPPDDADRARLASFAVAHDIGRVSWASAQGRDQPETLVSTIPLTIRFGQHTVRPPAGAFLQAAAAGEAAIRADVLDALPGRLRPGREVIELFAGSGTLTLPIADRLSVHAFEGDRDAATALARAAGGTRARVTLRDLARAPLAVPELARADAIVLDPPYGGAGRQIETVARASIPIVVLVSCNPAALSREARALRNAGYTLNSSRAIDQFLWSARVESVSVFRHRSATRPRRGR